MTILVQAAMAAQGYAFGVDVLTCVCVNSLAEFGRRWGTR